MGEGCYRGGGVLLWWQGVTVGRGVSVGGGMLLWADYVDSMFPVWRGSTKKVSGCLPYLCLWSLTTSALFF